MIRMQPVGLVPFVIERATYTAAGHAVDFRDPARPVDARTSAHVTFRVFTGTALVSLTGKLAGPFVELNKDESFDFPIATQALFIKGKGGDCEVSVVAALNPIQESV